MSSPLYRDAGAEFNEGDPEPALPHRAPLDPATLKKHRWLLDTYLNPAPGKRPMAQITAQQLLPLLKRIEQEGQERTPALPGTAQTLAVAGGTRRAIPKPRDS